MVDKESGRTEQDWWRWSDYSGGTNCVGGVAAVVGWHVLNLLSPIHVNTGCLCTQKLCGGDTDGGRTQKNGCKWVGGSWCLTVDRCSIQ